MKGKRLKSKNFRATYPHFVGIIGLIAIGILGGLFRPASTREIRLPASRSFQRASSMVGQSPEVSAVSESTLAADLKGTLDAMVQRIIAHEQRMEDTARHLSADEMSYVIDLLAVHQQAQDAAIIASTGRMP